MSEMVELINKAREMSEYLMTVPLTELIDYPRYTRAKLRAAAKIIDELSEKITAGCVCPQGCRMEDDLK